MLVLFKKTRKVNSLIEVTDKVEITKAFVKSDYLELMEVPQFLKITALLDKEQEADSVEKIKDLSKANLFVATGNPNKGVELHTLMSDEIYIAVDLGTDDKRLIENVMKKITLYLDEQPEWNGEDITLSRDYHVRYEERHGVLLDCTVNE